MGGQADAAMSPGGRAKQGQGIALAIDLGGTKASFALVDSSGAVRSRLKRSSRPGGVAITPDDLVASADEALRSAAVRWQDVSALGVIVPGVYDPATGLVWAPNLWGPDAVPLRSQLEARFAVPVTIDGDRSGCVLGEQWLGTARGCADVVFVAVGTGIGVGILSGGRLLRGSGGIAGAAGWFAIDPRWKPLYGQVGCWEAEAAGPAFARRAAARLAEGRPSTLRSACEDRLDALTAEMVADAARAGDPVATETVSETVEALAMGIANLISVLNPQVAVLGGGLMQAVDLFLEPVRRAVPRWAQPLAVKQCRIEPTLLGEDAGLLGAARLALFRDPSL
jgi:glucokinase